eukprot:gene1428-1769_t
MDFQQAAATAPIVPIQDDPSAHGASLHGENAARRQAITELLFFASVGDVSRCRKICKTWSIQVTNKEGHLIDLGDSTLSGNVRMFGEIDPEWEVDPNQIVFQEKAQYLGATVAVKVLKDTNAVALGDFRTEMNVLQKVHHPHAVQFFGAVTKQTPYMIITEFMGCGSMADMFRSKELPSLRRAVQLALDCARGIAYLHNHHPLSIIHRDLKPANLMIGGSSYIDSDMQRRIMLHELGTVKIADFGLSKSLKLNKLEVTPENSRTDAGNPDDSAQPRHQLQKKASPSYKLTGETGSYRYMAPEVFRHELYNHKVDQYAFAMICYQLFQGVPPFYLLDPIQAAQAAAQHGSRPEWGLVNRHNRKVPDVLKQLVERCWDPDYDKRPEMTAVIQELQKVLAQLPMEMSIAQRERTADSCCVVQ